MIALYKNRKSEEMFHIVKSLTPIVLSIDFYCGPSPYPVDTKRSVLKEHHKGENKGKICHRCVDAAIRSGMTALFAEPETPKENVEQMPLPL